MSQSVKSLDRLMVTNNLDCLIMIIKTLKSTIVFALAMFKAQFVIVIENVIFYGIYWLLSPFFWETVGGITHLRARCACSFDSSPLTCTRFANTVEFRLKSVK